MDTLLDFDWVGIGFAVADIEHRGRIVREACSCTVQVPVGKEYLKRKLKNHVKKPFTFHSTYRQKKLNTCKI